MLNDLGIDKLIRNTHCAECASTASFYENRIISNETQQSPLQSSRRMSKDSTNFGLYHVYGESTPNLELG
jgi:hypothetical protein